MAEFTFDSSNNLNVTIAGGGGGGTVTVIQPTASLLNAQVQGAAAADAAASGNPVLVGGIDAAGNVQELPVADNTATAPTQTLIIGGSFAGSANQLAVATTGAILTGNAAVPADATSNNANFPLSSSGNGFPYGVFPFLFNGTTWDRQRSGGATGVAAIAGAGAANSGTVGNPVQIAGADGAGNLRRLDVSVVGAATIGNVLLVGGRDSVLNAQPLGVAAAESANPTTVLEVGGVVTTSSPVYTTGKLDPLSLDTNGGLRVLSSNIPEATAAWTSATGANSAVTMTVLGYSAVAVTLNQGTTITGGVVTFEVSDTTAFTNAYPILATQSGVSTGVLASTFTLIASTNTAFMIPVAGWAAFRVRLSTVISGTATVNVGVQAANFPVTQNTVNQVSGSIVNARSNNAIASLADNQASTTFFPSSTNVNDPMAVGTWLYGGAFGGTTNAALTGWSKARTPTVFKNIAAVAVTAGTPVTVWTPGSGNKFRFLGYAVSLSVAGSVLFKDASTEMIRTPLMPAGIGQAAPNMGTFGILSAAANNVLAIDVSATGSVSGYVFGVEE